MIFYELIIIGEQQMAEINLITTTRKYVDLAETNLTFLNRVIKQKKEAKLIDLVSLNKKIRYATNKLKTLSTAQVTEWKEIHMNKLRQLVSQFTKKQNAVTAGREDKYKQYSSSIREELHMLVTICRELAMDYDSQEVAQIILTFYYSQYKQEILQMMEQSGYNVNRFRDLHYQSSFFSLCCCWQS